MKFRRHHNNKGLRQIRTGRTERSLKHIARRLGIPYAPTEPREIEKPQETASPQPASDHARKPDEN